MDARETLFKGHVSSMATPETKEKVNHDLRKAGLPEARSWQGEDLLVGQCEDIEYLYTTALQDGEIDENDTSGYCTYCRRGPHSAEKCYRRSQDERLGVLYEGETFKDTARDREMKFIIANRRMIQAARMGHCKASWKLFEDENHDVPLWERVSLIAATTKENYDFLDRFLEVVAQDSFGVDLLMDLCFGRAALIHLPAADQRLSDRLEKCVLMAACHRDLVQKAIDKTCLILKRLISDSFLVRRIARCVWEDRFDTLWLRPALGALTSVMVLAGRREIASDKTRICSHLASVMAPCHVLVCALASGSDIMAVEEWSRLKGSVRDCHIVLNTSRSAFMDASVEEEWQSRYQTILGQLEIDDGELVELDNVSYLNANNEIYARARALGDLENEGCAVVCWNGESRGDKDVTGHFAHLAEESGIPVHEIFSKNPNLHIFNLLPYDIWRDHLFTIIDPSEILKLSRVCFDLWTGSHRFLRETLLPQLGISEAKLRQLYK